MDGSRLPSPLQGFGCKRCLYTTWISALSWRKGPGQQSIDVRGRMAGCDGFEGRLEIGVRIDVVQFSRLDQLMECTPLADLNVL